MPQEEKVLYYNTLPKTINKNGDILIDKYCNSLTIVNIGPDIVTVNQLPLNIPAAGEVLGDSVSFGGNKGEIFVGRVTLSFATTTAPLVLVIQKVYLPHADKGCQL